MGKSIESESRLVVDRDWGREVGDNCLLRTGSPSRI